MKKIERFVVSAYQTNCYVLYQDQEALIVDPGARAERMIASIGRQNPEKRDHSRSCFYTCSYFMLYRAS